VFNTISQKCEASELPKCIIEESKMLYRSISNKKICKVLECEFPSIDEQFQALKQQENNNMTTKRPLTYT
jgi:transcription initiation factor TFIIIB Brf1 subunit/transcription initiation factor TFIIB